MCCKFGNFYDLCHNNNEPMKPTPDIIEEAARHGLVEGAKFESALAPGCTQRVIDPAQWTYSQEDGRLLNGPEWAYTLCYEGKWARVIEPAPQPARDEVRDRIAQAEENIAWLDRAIETMKAKIARMESANELLKELPPKWTPKFGDRVMTPRGEGIYWYKDSKHVVIFENGSKYYNLDQLSPIKP